MLETIREYAAERLAGDGANANALLRRRHLTHYVSLAEHAAPRLRAEQQRLWLDRLDVDHDNLRAALVAARELDDNEAGLRLGVALRWYAFWRKRCRDLVEPLALIIADSEQGHSLVTDAQLSLAVMQMDVYQYAEAGVTLAQALTSVRKMGDAVRFADALWVAAWLAYYTRDLARAEALGIEGLAAAEAANDLDTTARMHGVVAIAVSYGDDITAARRHFESELAGYLEMGDRMAEGMCHNNLGNTELNFGNVDRADQSFEPAEAIARELDLPELLAVVILYRSNVADLRGDEASALARAVEGISLVHRHGITRLTASALVACARALSPIDPQLSATLHGATRAAVTRASHDPLGPFNSRLRGENAIRLRATLGDDTYEERVAIGHELSTPELLALMRPHAPGPPTRQPA